jgi:hypothetical protein
MDCGARRDKMYAVAVDVFIRGLDALRSEPQPA